MENRTRQVLIGSYNENNTIKNHSKSAQKMTLNVLNTTEDITDIDNKVYEIVDQ